MANQEQAQDNEIFDYEIENHEISVYDIEDVTDIDKNWFKLKTFKGLLTNNRLFIKGEIPNTPEHYGRLQETDPGYIERLLKLNTIGLLTTNGQEFKRIIQKDKITMQREYINFVYKIPKYYKNINLKLAELITRFNKCEVFYYAIDYDSKKLYQTPGLGRIDFDNHEFWVTRSQDRHTKEYINHTHIAQPIDSLDTEYSYFARDFYKGSIFFQVWNKTWDDEDKYLLDKIIECFEYF
jgi:hypothetical protein